MGRRRREPSVRHGLTGVARLHVLANVYSMTMRFRRSLRSAPGVRLNAGLGGLGISLGGHGVHAGFNTRTGGYVSGSAGGLYVMQHMRNTQGEHRIVRDGSVSWVTAFAIATIVYWILIFKNC